MQAPISEVVLVEIHRTLCRECLEGNTPRLNTPVRLAVNDGTPRLVCFSLGRAVFYAPEHPSLDKFLTRACEVYQ